jgi:TRAP-type C4-dicarboxylate transport system permease small subunit
MALPIGSAIALVYVLRDLIARLLGRDVEAAVESVS